MSGQGDCGLKSDDDCAIDILKDDDSLSSSENNFSEKKSRKKGESKEESLKTHSSQFFSFVNHNPVAFYFCTVFVKYKILESYSSDMSDDHSGGSKGCKSVGYGIVDKGKAKNESPNAIDLRGDSGESTKASPIVKAASVLAQLFASAMASSSPEKMSKECKDDEIKKALLEADEASKIVKNGDGLDEDLARCKEEYFERMKKKVHILLEID